MQGSPRRRRTVAGLGIAVVLTLVAVGWIHALQRTDSELHVYIHGAQRMLAGESIYVPADDKPFTYPPLFALLFAPLTLLDPPELQRSLWYALNLAILAGIFAVFAGWYREITPVRARAPTAITAGIVVALSARHVAACLNTGSHDLVLAGVLVVAAGFWFRGRTFAAAALAGVGAALKATPLLFLVLFAARGQGRAVAAMLGAAAIVTLACECLPGPGSLWIVDWWTTMVAPLDPTAAATRDGVWEASYFNQSLTCSLHRTLGPFAPDLLRGATLLLQGGVVLAIVVTVRTARRSPEPFARLIEWAAIVNGMLLLSPVTSKWHFCLWLLPAFVIGAALTTNRANRAVAVLAALVFAGSALSSRGVVGRDLGIALARAGTFTWSALGMAAILVMIARCAASRTRAPAAHAVRRRAPRLLVRATAALAGTIAALALAELGVRVLPIALPPGIRSTVSLHDLSLVARHHDRLGYALLPDVRDRPLSTTDYAVFRASTQVASAHDASVGFRDEFGTGPTWGALIGDSFAMGWGVDDAQTFETLTECALERRILNFGVAGWGPQQALAALEEFALAYEPEVVLWAYYPNDLRDATLFERWDPSWTMFRKKSAFSLALNRHCSLYKLYRYLAAPRSSKAYVWSSGDVSYVFTHRWQSAMDVRREEVRHGLDLTRRFLDRLAALGKQHGFRTVVVALPFREQVYYEEYATTEDCAVLPRAQVDGLYRQVIEHAAGLGFATLDLLPDLRRHKDEQIYFRHDCHFTATGNRIVADRLTEFLRAEILPR